MVSYEFIKNSDELSYEFMKVHMVQMNYHELSQQRWCVKFVIYVARIRRLANSINIVPNARDVIWIRKNNQLMMMGTVSTPNGGDDQET